MQKHQDIKNYSNHCIQRSQERIPKDHRDGARMRLGHAPEGGRCLGTLQVLQLLEAEHSKHVRTTHHYLLKCMYAGTSHPLGHFSPRPF